jgi:DNA-binding HxlR family transcriptional regulator
VLSIRLKELEQGGFVVRRDFGTMPLRVEYSLTPKGRMLDAELRRSETQIGAVSYAPEPGRIR